MKGPCAGGTHVTMTGENLDYGSDIAVTFFTFNSRILWFVPWFIGNKSIMESKTATRHLLLISVKRAVEKPD